MHTQSLSLCLFLSANFWWCPSFLNRMDPKSGSPWLDHAFHASCTQFAVYFPGPFHLHVAGHGARSALGPSSLGPPLLTRPLPHHVSILVQNFHFPGEMPADERPQLNLFLWKPEGKGLGRAGDAHVSPRPAPRPPASPRGPRDRRATPGGWSLRLGAGRERGPGPG